jgi:hypothetical protein
MKKRDVCAACAGFTGACALLAVVRYLAEPTALIAALLVTCGVAFMATLGFYAEAITTRRQVRRRRPRPVRGNVVQATTHAGEVQSTPSNGQLRPARRFKAPSPAPAAVTA